MKVVPGSGVYRAPRRRSGLDITSTRLMAASFALVQSTSLAPALEPGAQDEFEVVWAAGSITSDNRHSGKL